MSKNPTINLRGDARAVHQLHLEAHARREGLGQEYGELMKKAWGTPRASNNPPATFDRLECRADNLNQLVCQQRRTKP